MRFNITVEYQKPDAPFPWKRHIILVKAEGLISRSSLQEHFESLHPKAAKVLVERL